MDTDWPVVTRELLIGAIALVVGLIIIFARHRFTKSRRQEDKEDREKRERVEALTKGTDDPEAIKRAATIPGLLKLGRPEDLRELGAGPRARLLLFLLIIVLVSLVTIGIFVLR